MGAAKTALDNISLTERDYVFSVAMSGNADLIEKLTPEQRAAYDYMIGQVQKGLITVFPKPDRDLTDGKLVNPGYSDQQGIVNTGNHQPLESGPKHTGSSEGLVSTGGTSTSTPIPDAPSKDDLAYLSTGKNTVRPNGNESTRFIDGVSVRDIKTGESFSGTVDLKPTLDRIQSGHSYPHRNDGSTFQNRPDRDTEKQDCLLNQLDTIQNMYIQLLVYLVPALNG